MSVRADDPPRRREHLDWLRGVAVLLMIEAHLFDSWTRLARSRQLRLPRADDRRRRGHTLFLFLAGVSVALSAGSKLRRTGSRSRGGKRRGPRVGSRSSRWPSSSGSRRGSSAGRTGRPTLLKVDILNIMGPSIVAAALLWRLGTSSRARALIFAAATAATALLTPLIRTLPLAFLPPPILAYIVPVAGLSNFVVFPWTALVLAGAFVGVLIDAAQTPALDRRIHRRLAAGGAIVSHRRVRRVVPADAVSGLVLLDHVTRIPVSEERPGDARRGRRVRVGPALGRWSRTGARSSSSDGPRCSSTGSTSSWCTA